MKLSPTSIMILKTINVVIKEKPSLIRIDKSRFDFQFINLLGIWGITNYIEQEVDYLEEIGMIEAVGRKDSYMGNTRHYTLTKKGLDALKK